MSLDLRESERLIVYGGTFDPPHRAHVTLPLEAMRKLGADGVLYVPAGKPPHKDDKRTAGEHRLVMLKLALEGREDAAISTWELEHGGPSYTVRTLEHLRKELGDRVEMRLLIGVDMALIFEQWREPQRIVELAKPAVMLRPPMDRGSFLGRLPAEQREFWAGCIVEVPAMDISSTEVRRMLREGGPDDPRLADVLEPKVRDYIRQHGLYAG